MVRPCWEAEEAEVPGGAAQPLQLPCSQVPRAHATLSASGSSRRMIDDVGVPRVHAARERQRRRTTVDGGCPFV